MRAALALAIAGTFLAACAGSTPTLVHPGADRPPTSSAEVRRALAAALEREDAEAITLGMMYLSRMGATLSPETQARLAPFLDRSALPHDWQPSGPLAEAFAHNFRGNARASDSGSQIIAEVPAEHRLIEGIAWDEASDRLFVGSVVDRRLLVQSGSGWEVVRTGALGGVFGMAIDPDRRLLWLASGTADPVPEPETTFAGLVAIDLDRLEEVERIEVPGARLGDVALAEDGTVYASDGQSGAIYRCQPGCIAVEVLVPPGILRSPQGLVVWPDDDSLYVADYAMGLLHIDLSSLQITPLTADEPQMLEGIDGLLRAGDLLIGIQNGTLPRRIIAIYLSRGRRIVKHVRVLQQDNPEWGEPTLGAIVGYHLYYIADSQWERFGPNGTIVDGGAPRPTAIRSVGWELIVGSEAGARGLQLSTTVASGAATSGWRSISR